MARQRSSSAGVSSPVVGQTSIDQAAGIEMMKCPACEVNVSHGLVLKHGGKCPRCEEPIDLPDGTPKSPSVAIAEDGKKIPAAQAWNFGGEVVDMGPAKGAPLPGAEPRPGDPTCEECGARLTVTAKGSFCPDASIRHKQTNAWKEPAKPKEPETTSKDANREVFKPAEGRFVEAPQPRAHAKEVKLTLGTIMFRPAEYHTFTVGPFEVTYDTNLGGLDLEEAMKPLYALQEKAFEEQAERYKAFMRRLYGEKGRP